MCRVASYHRRSAPFRSKRLPIGWGVEVEAVTTATNNNINTNNSTRRQHQPRHQSHLLDVVDHPRAEAAALFARSHGQQADLDDRGPHRMVADGTNLFSVLKAILCGVGVCSCRSCSCVCGVGCGCGWGEVEVRVRLCVCVRICVRYMCLCCARVIFARVSITTNLAFVSVATWVLVVDAKRYLRSEATRTDGSWSRSSSAMDRFREARSARSEAGMGPGRNVGLAGDMTFSSHCLRLPRVSHLDIL